MQDSDSDDCGYHDRTSDEHGEGGSSPGGVADKEMNDVLPTTETLANQAPPVVSGQQPSELGRILDRLVIGQERQERCLTASIDKQAESVVLLKEQMN
jgi:hypothetical protein